MLRRCYLLAESSSLFMKYHAYVGIILMLMLSLITLKKLLQSAMIITNCDSTTTKKLLANYASRENFKFNKLLY